MRLTHIKLQNFKGVAERQSIEVGPVTLLFGPNSAGKSTVLQALAYLYEILARGNLDAERTEIGGESIELGGFRNLLHDHDLGRRMGIGMRYTRDDENAHPDISRIHYAISEFNDWEEEERFDETIFEFVKRIKSLEFFAEFSWSNLQGRPQTTYLESVVNDQFFAAIEISSDGRDSRLVALNLRHPICYGSPATSAAEFANEQAELLRPIIDQSDEAKALLAGWRAQARTPTDEEWRQFLDIVEDGFSGIEKFDLGPNWLGELIQENAKQSLIRDGELRDVPVRTGEEILQQDRLMIEFEAIWAGRQESRRNPMHTPKFMGPIMDSGYEFPHSMVATALNVLLLCPVRHTREHLRKLKYIGPLRHLPERTALVARTSHFLNWADGSAAWQLMAVADESKIVAINQWLAGPEAFDSGFEVRVEQFRAIPEGSRIVNALQSGNVLDEEGLAEDLRSVPVQSRIAFRNVETGALIAPKDLGIGVSQLLPIVVAAVDARAGFIAIEQPELHIHPRLQVVLGDLFLQRAAASGCQFIIETHSEHLMLRLLRRIRETSDGELPPGLAAVTPNQIAVNYVNQQGGATRFQRLAIREDGDFADKWPDGFFAERGDELF